MKKQVLIFYKKNGEITNKKVVRQAIDMLQDGRYKMEITGASKRSNSQNAYFHSVILSYVLEGLQNTGYEDVKTLEDAKTVVKSLFLKEKIINKETGELLTEYVRESSSLTTGEFKVFIDQILQWSAEYLGISIPLPGEPATIF